MEDAYTAVPFLLEVPVSGGAQEDRIPPRIAPQVCSVSGCLPDSLTLAGPRQAASRPAALLYGRVSSAALPKAYSASAMANPPPYAEMSALHFFGVFDGHGGADAAILCARTLHERLAEALHSGALALSNQAADDTRQQQQAQHRRQGSDEMPEASANSASSSSTAVSVRSTSGGGLQAGAAHAAAIGALQRSSPANAPSGDLQLAPASDEMDYEASAAAAQLQVDQQQQLAKGDGQQQQNHQQQAAAAAAAANLPFSANAFEHAFTEAFSKVCCMASPILQFTAACLFLRVAPCGPCMSQAAFKSTS